MQMRLPRSGDLEYGTLSKCGEVGQGTGGRGMFAGHPKEPGIPPDVAILCFIYRFEYACNLFSLWDM